MSQGWTAEKWQETLKALYQRAATDEGFRKRCLEDAHGAIREISGLDFPEGAKVRFVEKLEEQVLVLPTGVPTGEEELSDDDLKVAAGGCSIPLCLILTWICHEV